MSTSPHNPNINNSQPTPPRSSSSDDSITASAPLPPDDNHHQYHQQQEQQQQQQQQQQQRTNTPIAEKSTNRRLSHLPAQYNYPPPPPPPPPPHHHHHAVQEEDPSEKEKQQDSSNPNNRHSTSDSESGSGNPSPPDPPDVDPHLLTFTHPLVPPKLNPHTYSIPRKLLITSVWVYGNLVTCIASSIWSSGTRAIQLEFQVSQTVVTLGVSLFLLGYAAGPPIWGPLSETQGRRWPMMLGLLGFTCFCIPVAVGENMQTLLVGRFFQGVFGSAPLSLTAGGVVDIWPDPMSRGTAVVCCIGTIFGSPILAPLMGNFMVQNGRLGWRWTQWLSCIMGVSCLFFIFFCLPETLGPKVLRDQARKVRKSQVSEGGDPEARGPGEGGTKMSLGVWCRTYFLRPFILLGTEPILVLITIYQSFIYGILYLVFISFPIAFQGVRNWALGVSSLPFLGLLVGVVLGALVTVWHTRSRIPGVLAANGGRMVPEERLPMMIVGGCLLPVGLFIFAWTSRPDIHPSGMIVGSIPLGMGMYMVFVQCFNYLIDVYALIANSALGGNTLVRSVFGAVFPLFAPFMYEAMGVDWATSLLGFVSIAMIPIPMLFYKYGSRIRSWSKNSMSL